MLKPRKRRITVIQKPNAKTVRYIVAATVLKGRRGEGHYNNTIAPKKPT